MSEFEPKINAVFNKKIILLGLIYFLIIPSVFADKGEVIVVPAPHFQRDFLFITTEGDSISYSFTFINTGNETIKNQKLWYDLLTPSRRSYDIKPIEISELKPGENITLEGGKFYLSENGDYVLKFGINTNGEKNTDNTVILNGKMETNNIIQHSFYTYNKDLIITAIIGVILTAFFGLIIKK